MDAWSLANAYRPTPLEEAQVTIERLEAWAKGVDARLAQLQQQLDRLIAEKEATP